MYVKWRNLQNACKMEDSAKMRVYDVLKSLCIQEGGKCDVR